MIAVARRIGMVGIIVELVIGRPAAAESQPLTVDATLCDDAIGKTLSDAIVSEATAVLRDAGIGLNLKASRTCEHPSSLLVRIELRPAWRGVIVPTRGVGSIQFIDGQPDRTITLSLWAASYLIEHDPVVHTSFERVGPLLREKWTGRMLGRALAHEVVHYVLRSPRHSRTGLMRPTHSVEAFVGRDRSPFRLRPADHQALSLLTANQPVDSPRTSMPK